MKIVSWAAVPRSLVLVYNLIIYSTLFLQQSFWSSSCLDYHLVMRGQVFYEFGILDRSLHQDCLCDFYVKLIYGSLEA